MAKKRRKKRAARPPSSPPNRRPSPAQPSKQATQGQQAKQAQQAKPPKPSRSERIESAQRQRRRRRLLRRSMAGGAVLVALAVIAIVVIGNRRASERTISRLEAGACSFDRDSDSDEGQGRNHVSGSPTYRVNPPAGGNHLVTAAAARVYDQQVPPDGQIVHAMEHGDVVLWHRPDIPGAVLDELRDLANTYSGDVLVVPRASLDTPVAATAWHRRLLCPNFERAATDLFIRSYRDKGPEKVPEAE